MGQDLSLVHLWFQAPAPACRPASPAARSGVASLTSGPWFWLPEKPAELPGRYKQMNKTEGRMKQSQQLESNPLQGCCSILVGGNLQPSRCYCNCNSPDP